MKNIFRHITLSTSKIDAHTLRTILYVGSLIVFSLIAGAPNIGGGNG